MTSERGEWTKPAVLLTIISLLMASVGGYLAIARNDTQSLEQRITNAERDIAVLKVRIEYDRR